MSRNRTNVKKRVFALLGFALAALLVGGGFAVASHTSNQPDWNGVYACVHPNGTLAYFQFNPNPAGDCWDGSGGLQQWHWPADKRVNDLAARVEVLESPEHNLPLGSKAGDEDAVVPLPPGQDVEIATLEGQGSRVVTASVTVSSNADNGNMLCFLRTSGGDALAANAKDDRESFALTALVGDEVSLVCRADDGGSATDASMTGVEVTTP